MGKTLVFSTQNLTIKGDVVLKDGQQKWKINISLEMIVKLLTRVLALQCAAVIPPFLHVLPFTIIRFFTVLVASSQQ